jgi:HEAT repeat protein
MILARAAGSVGMILLHLAVLFLLLGASQAAHAQATKDTKSTQEAMLGGKTLTQWIREFQDRDPSIRENAVRSVPHFGLDGRKALPGLIEEFHSTDSGIRANAANAVGLLGLDEKNLKAGVTGLTRLLKDTQAVVRLQAVTALGHIGPAASDALPTLASIGKDSTSWEIRRAVAFALGAVGQDRSSPDTRAVNALVNALSDASAPVRLEAVKAFLRLGPPAQAVAKKSAIQGLQRLFTDRDDIVIIWARVAVMRLDQVSETYLSAITQYLKNADAALRSEAATALGTIGLAAKAHVPDLQEAIDKEKEAPAVVLASLWALTRMGDGGKKVLTKLTKHENPDIKKAAADALASMPGAKAKLTK